LSFPAELYRSSNSKDKQDAEQRFFEIAEAIFKDTSAPDPFWNNSAKNLFLGSGFALMKNAREEEINLPSLQRMVEEGDDRYGIGSTYMKELCDLSKDDENVFLYLKSYVTTANDTKAGIHSTFSEKMSIATMGEAVRKFLSRNDFRINELTGDKPVLTFIILPEETPIYNNIVGVLVNQLMNHYVRIAELNYGGKLPLRQNFILEEMGSIARAIPNLDNLLAAGRSRNISVTMIMQSVSQLKGIYGESKAATILDNCRIHMLFRVNHWDTLNEYSRKCGEREIFYDGRVIKEPLINPSQLGAMGTGQALVIIGGRIKFITFLPDFSKMEEEEEKEKEKGLKKRNVAAKKAPQKVSYFDIKKYVDERRLGVREDLSKKNQFQEPTSFIKNSMLPPEKKKDFDELIKEIDQQISRLEKEGAKKRERKGKQKKAQKETENSGISTKSEKTGEKSKQGAPLEVVKLVILAMEDEKRTAAILKQYLMLDDEMLKNIMTKVKAGNCAISPVEKSIATKIVFELEKVRTMAVIQPL